MKQVNLGVFLHSLRKRPYRGLIQEYVRKEKPERLLQAYKKTISRLPAPYQGLLDPFIHHMNRYLDDKEFWQKSGCEVFDLITDAAYQFHLGHIRSYSLEEYVSPEDQEMLYHLFQLVTLNYAYLASQQPELRQVMGIKKGFWRWLGSEKAHLWNLAAKN